MENLLCELTRQSVTYQSTAQEIHYALILDNIGGEGKVKRGQRLDIFQTHLIIHLWG